MAGMPPTTRSSPLLCQDQLHTHYIEPLQRDDGASTGGSTRYPPILTFVACACRHACLTDFLLAQSYESVIEILKSLLSVKGVVIEVKSEIFGVAWARSNSCPQPTYEGVIQAWKKKNLELYVKWPGYTQNKAVPLSALQYDTEGASLELRLKNYEDGRPAPVLHVPPPPRQGEQGPGDLEGDQDEDDEAHNNEEVHDEGDHQERDGDEEVGEDQGGSDADGEQLQQGQEQEELAPDTVTQDGQVWRRRIPTYVREDARDGPRTKPSLNKGDIVLKSIADMFSYLVPDDWWDTQLRYTNPKLLATDKESAKLSVGELKQWWGYALALSINPGVPIERAWSITPQPGSVLPPMSMGRHGMSIKRWKKVRSVLTFGPTDELALTHDNWAFVRPLVDSFNRAREQKVVPGWLLGVDELMCAWRGAQGKLDQRKCPKLSWVPRKPEPLGVECKAAGDAISGEPPP